MTFGSNSSKLTHVLVKFYEVFQVGRFIFIIIL